MKNLDRQLNAAELARIAEKNRTRSVWDYVNEECYPRPRALGPGGEEGYLVSDLVAFIGRLPLELSYKGRMRFGKAVKGPRQAEAVSVDKPSVTLLNAVTKTGAARS